MHEPDEPMGLSERDYASASGIHLYLSPAWQMTWGEWNDAQSGIQYFVMNFDMERCLRFELIVEGSVRSLGKGNLIFKHKNTIVL